MNTTEIIRKPLRLLLCGLAACVLGCTEEEPPVVWDPADQGGATPVITSISPAGAAWSGITPMVISGSGFSALSTVYIGTGIGTLTGVTPTELTLIAPRDTGSGFTIKVVNSDAYQYASIGPYALYSINTDVAKLIDSSTINALEVDDQGTVYVHQLAKVYKVAPGQGQALVGATSDVPVATVLRLNRDGYLYMANRAKTRIYRLDLATGVESEYVWVKGYAEGFDFGANGKTIYSGGSKNFSVIDSNRVVTKTAYYTADVITAVRVFQDFVYVVLANGIWRNKINADGTLGAPEQYFNWQNAGPASSSSINDITFALNGDLYVATDYQDPVLVVHPDGTSSFLYPGALDSPISNFVWGSNAPHLYMNYATRGGRRIGQVDMDANLAPLNMNPIIGAPYNGRDL